MRSYAAAHSEHPVTVEAAGEVLGDLSERMGGDSDLAIVFASGGHVAGLNDVASGLTELFGVNTVLGLSVSGVVSGGREVETGDGLSVWIGDTGPVRPLRLEAIDSGRTILGLPSDIAEESIVLLLVDPFSFPVDSLIDALAEAHPTVRVVGGLASAGRSPGENTLVLDAASYDGGAIGVILPPGVATPVVSQGCRPIGQPWVITDGSGQMIRQLGGEPAMDRLQAMIDALSDEDRVLAARGLHIGIVANEQSEKFDRGDFLIRSLMGVDRSSGALAVGDAIEVGQVVQLHVRDAASASEDLWDQLTRAEITPQGSLVFTCTGRGTHMFAEPHHDAATITEVFSEIANAGMFCAGEIGPVGPRNAVHGFTATMLLF